ncbi:unnamed protein product [Gadus morhua 'NCC']
MTTWEPPLLLHLSSTCWVLVSMPHPRAPPTLPPTRWLLSRAASLEQLLSISQLGEALRAVGHRVHGAQLNRAAGALLKPNGRAALDGPACQAGLLYSSNYSS